MRRALRIAALVIVGSSLLSPTLLLAGEWTHRVLAGESASAIAKRYYGSFEPTRLLLDYNGREGATLRAGETLRIPYCEVHVVRAGDTWSELARRYLGRGATWPTMAELNGRAPGEALPRGARVVAPVTLVHRLARGETLAALAQRYYGDTDRAALLAEFNGVDDPRRLSVGQSLGVPLIDFVPLPGAEAERTVAQTPVESNEVAATPTAGRANAAGAADEPGPDAPSATPQETAGQSEESEPVPPRFAAALRRAQRAFREARFGSARAQLDRMGERIVGDGAEDDLEAYWTLRAFLAVAEGRAADACKAWFNLPTGRAAPRLDPDLVSPRLRDVLESCGRDGSDAQAVTRRPSPPSS